MFFGLTNLQVTFQAMINDLLKDMIKAGDVVVFIDDVMVKTETSKRHDNIVEEVFEKNGRE